MPPARKGSKAGAGTCSVCSKTDVLTSTCESTGQEYCRDVYSCRKGAGVNVKGTGTGAKKRKRQRKDGGDESSGGGVPSLEARLVLNRPDQIIGHRLFNSEALLYLDPRRGEPLLESNHEIEFYVRGVYKRSPSDPGLVDTLWRPQRELAEWAQRGLPADENFQRVVQLAKDYQQAMAAAFNRALGVEAAVYTLVGSPSMRGARAVENISPNKQMRGYPRHRPGSRTHEYRNFCKSGRATQAGTYS